MARCAEECVCDVDRKFGNPAFWFEGLESYYVVISTGQMPKMKLPKPKCKRVNGFHRVFHQYRD
jgi:hypothetical protein